MAGFRGISQDQDSRFKDKQDELLKNTMFPSSYESKVQISKVNIDSIKPWIKKKIEECLGFEDEVLVNLIINMIATEMDPRIMQINLTGFLETHTVPFMTQLWDLLVEAQETISGVPQSLGPSLPVDLRNSSLGRPATESKEPYLVGRRRNRSPPNRRESRSPRKHRESRSPNRDEQCLDREERRLREKCLKSMERYRRRD